MATYTTFLHLEKPSTSERLDVLKINSNWDLIDAGVSALNSQITTLSGQKANVQKGNIAGGASETIAITRPAFVSVGRASNTATSTTAFIDGWGISYLSNNTGAFTLSMSDNNLTITNLSGGYCSYIVVF